MNRGSFTRMLRVVLPEILDQLPEDHPDALANRRDMRRLNCLMGNFRWIAGRLQEQALPSHIQRVEIAAGDGGLAPHLLKVSPLAGQWKMTGVDFWKRPDCWPQSWQWEQADALEADAVGAAEVVIANHIFHQFSDESLQALGHRLQTKAKLLIINETCRKPIHLWQARFLGLLGMNYVSRQDALTSIRAGFRDEELPALLGLSPEEWSWSIEHTPLGSYRMFAQRKEGTIR